MANIEGIELVKMTTEELKQRLGEEQESLQVLDGVRKERADQIQTHREAIRSLEDAIFNSIPVRAKAMVNTLVIQDLLTIRAASS